MADRWEFYVSGYYGPGGRKGTRANPNRGRDGEREGQLAATVGCNGSASDAEVAAFKSRSDIGEIIVTGPAESRIIRRTADGWDE